MSTRLHSSPSVAPARQVAGPDIIRVAAIQMASGPKVDGNLREAERLLEIAADQGAKLAALPEYFGIMGMSDRDKVAVREEEGRGPIQSFLSEAALRHRMWIVGGSVPLAGASADKVRNSCLVYDDTGRQVARYDKIHLFGFRMGAEE